jgi:hypothetical protein
MKAFALSLVVIALSFCEAGCGADTKTHQNEMPPLDILEGNFEQAQCVLEIEVEDVSQVAEFRSDAGEIGYVQYSVSGAVLATFKPSEAWESPPENVVYRFTQEHDATAIPAVIEGGRYLVFLTHADDSPLLWLIGNGAQFEMSPQLSETIRRITAQFSAASF